MKLGDLIDQIILERDQNIDHVEISAVVTDSRKAKPGAMFVCLDGATGNGHSFVQHAIRNGADAVVVKNRLPEFDQYQETVFLVHENPELIAADLLNRFYGDPSKVLTLIGITGTNGKTTTTYLIESIYQTAGKSCGVIGTVNYRFDGQVLNATNTTPGLADNVAYLNDMVEKGVETCVMEVSSHALEQQRVKGLFFKQAIFSNLTSDHLDYHRTQEEYFLAKSRFFDGSNHVEMGIINKDDPCGKRLIKLSTSPVMTYGIDQAADITAENIVLRLNGSEFDVVTPKGRIHIETPLIGKHNIYNILAAASACFAEGFLLDQIQQGVESLRVVPGRLERIEESRDFFVFVDYAHTEDALKNVLESIRGAGAGRILTVFGCGGDRDKTKRPKMAAVVEQYTDIAVVTTDNPRAEEPADIVKDILEGFSGKDFYEVVIDREEAIRHVLALAKPGDCILIAGKGHEDYQIFKDRTIHFDDREMVRRYLQG